MTRTELLRAWVDALESGKYEQGLGALRIGEAYCCLGVACDISGIGEWQKPTATGGIKWTYAHGKFEARNYLPMRLQDEMLLAERQQGELVGANDRGESFASIAQRIREMFPDVFTSQAA